MPGTAAFAVDEPWESSNTRKANAGIELLVNMTSAQRIATPLPFVKALRAAACAQTAMPRCILIFKLFDSHFISTIAQYDAKLLRPLFLHPGARIVVLERSPNDEHCSLLWALESRKWWTPSRSTETAAAYEKFKQSNCSDTARRGDFDNNARQHSKWFGVVRDALKSTPDAESRSMEVTYSDTVERHDGTIAVIEQRLIQDHATAAQQQRCADENLRNVVHRWCLPVATGA